MKYFFTKYRFFLSGAALILTAASCTSTLSDEPATDACAISFTPAAETRAAVGTYFPKGSSFSVWGWYGTDSQITNNVFDGETVTKSGEAWTYTGGTRYWIAGRTYNFYGVYPVYPQTSSDNGTTATVDATGKITVTNFDCSATGENAVDLMTATAQGDGSNPSSVAMQFKHELARVNIIVTSEGDAVKISNAKIYGINHMGTLSNDQWKVGEVSTETNPSFSSSLEISLGDTKPYGLFGGDLLLIPASNEKLINATLSFDYQYVNGTFKSEKIKLKRDRIQEWVAGSQYKYTVAIPKNAIDVTVNVEILKWNEKNYTVTW